MTLSSGTEFSRTEKYTLKLQKLNEPWSPIIKKLADEMIAHYTVTVRDWLAVDARVREILFNFPTEKSVFRPWYLVFARQLYKLQRKFAGDTLSREAAAIQQMWTNRGLTPAVLDAIRLGAFGILPPSS
jgi:hypothetical protein